ncbi:scaffold protein [Stenotrophomonas phage BUCT609]|uniref:Scaffold protein n=1 Tax=Stenotrophomonas phage BUCT609 TaxID=2834250 RepID=A0A8E6PM16_9CAUD|nr:scaffold protein [Stenotrophomonas phage BUCT609]
MSDENNNGNTNPNPANPADSVVTPPAQVPANEPAKVPSGDDKTRTSYTHDSGSSQLNHAVNHFVNNLGLSVESPEIQEFLKNGNVDYLKGYVASNKGDLASLDPFIALATAGRGELEAASKAAYEALEKQVHEYAGGKEQWESISTFIKANSTDEEMDAFDKVLDAGGPAARMLIEGFKARLAADPNTSTVGKEATVPGVAATEPAGVKQYSSKAEWRAAQRALIAQHGFANYENTPEGKALMAAFHPGLQ